MARINEEEHRQIVAEIKAKGLDFTEKVDIEEFLVLDIDKVDSETYPLSHPQIVNHILSVLGLLKSGANPKTTPYLTTNILGKYQDA